MKKLLKNIELRIKPLLSGLTSEKRQKINFLDDIIKEFGIKRILFLRHDRIGDLIISEPIFRYMKDKYPELEIDVLLSTYNKSAVNCIISYINNYYVYDKSILNSAKLVSELKKNKYDLVVDLMDKKSSTSGILIKHINPMYSAGLLKENSDIYNFIIDRIEESNSHIIERTSELLKLFGINPKTKDLRPQYNLNKQYKPAPIDELVNQNRKFIAVNLSGSNQSKYWGIDNNIEFIKKVKTIYPDHVCVVIFTKHLAEIANEICSKTDALKCDLLNPFDEYVYALSKADMIITPDSSAVHIASAFNIKTIVLYNQDIDNKDILMPWYPFNTPHIAIGSKTGSLLDIEVGTVIDKLQNGFK